MYQICTHYLKLIAAPLTYINIKQYLASAWRIDSVNEVSKFGDDLKAKYIFMWY